MLPASMAPSVLPAPTSIWISSINNIILPSDSLTSFRTAFNLSSNSPRYLAPATNALKSNSKTVLSNNDSGTSFLTIRCANPSTIAVLPTPGSPMSTGLFLVLRLKIRIVFRISSSLPITGSILPCLTSSTKSRPYLANAW
ncbi:Uncharacterised protein [Staphylococcus aureus]|nr:Uncharacterised protein [Staphylococcus aureus]